MRQSSNPFTVPGAIVRPLFAVAAGLALLLTTTTVRAQETVIWKPAVTSGTWDTTTANWTASGSDARFANGDAVVFGLDANGNATNQAAVVYIAPSGFTVGPQPYGGIGTGTNPGMIIGSGSWFFIGGGQAAPGINGGTMLITGSAAYQYANSLYNEVSGTGGGRLYIRDQRIEVVDNADFKYSTSINQTLEFWGTNAYTGDGGAIHTGSNSDLTLHATYGGIFFYTQTTSQRGGAIYTGGDLNFAQTTTGTQNWFNTLFDRNSAGGQGGAIYSAGDVNMVISSGTNAFLTPTFTGNKSGAEGGAIYAKGNVTLSGSSLATDNTAALQGGAIYAEGNITMNGSANFTGNTAGREGGAIYTRSNLNITGTGASAYFAKNKSSDAASTVAYVGGTFSLTDGAKIQGEGAFAAGEFNFSNAIIAPEESGVALSGTMLFSTLDATGTVAAAPGKIKFDNTTITAHFGEIAVNEGSNITITGTLLVQTTATTGGRDITKPTTISANLTGDGELAKYGGSSLLLSGSNDYTGPTSVFSGTLIGNIAEGGVLNVYAGGFYRSSTNSGAGQPVDRVIGELNGNGVLDMAGANVRISAGDFGEGIVRNVNTLTKADAATTLIIGSGTVANLDLAEGALYMGTGKQLVVTGTATLAASTVLGVNISDDPVLKTGSLDAQAGSFVNITGYGIISDFTGSGTHTLIESNSGINHSSYTILLDGNPISAPPTDDSQFLAFTQLLSSDTTVTVTSALVWNNTSGSTAHGTFNVTSGTFTLNAALADNPDTAAYFGGWDGKSLTKTGNGVLILNGTNVYTGTTIVSAGALINNSNLENSSVRVNQGGYMYNTGTIKGDIDNAGVFVFESLVVNTGTYIIAETGTYIVNNTGTFLITTPTVAFTGTTGAISGTITYPIYTNGYIGNLHNTGTAGLDISLDYEYTGTLSGTGGAIVKTGTATFTLTGSNTYAGNVEIYNGALKAGKAHILDSAATYTLTNAAAVLDFGGYNQNLKDVVNYGLIRFGPEQDGTAFNSGTVTIANYSGTGAIYVRSDYSIGKADTLRITGTATGDHTIIISNKDSGQSSKSQDSIPLIYVSSNTALADATFSGTTESGIGILTVHRGEQGSLISPDPNIWYLAATSKLSNTADAILTTISVTGLEWLYSLDSVRQRMGDLRQESLMAPPEKKQSPLAYTTVTSKGGNAWLRGHAYHLDAKSDITGVPFKEDVFGVSFGFDKTYRWEDNQYLLGGDAGIGNVKRTFADGGQRTITGNGKTNNYGLGFYFSYLKDNGWYGDTVLRFTNNKNTLEARAIDGFTNTADYNQFTWGFSVEVGKVVKNKKTGWWYEPSGQAAIAILNGKTFRSSNDIEIKIADTNVTQYRFSLRAGRDVTGTPFKPYVRAAAVYVESWGGRVRAGTTYFKPDMDGFRGEAGVGMSYVLDERSQLYVDYEYAKASSYQRPWSFNFGYRHTW